jgi:hypothetical protein
MTSTPSLKFGIGNSKLGSHIAVFDLPAGFTCGGARDCLAFANRDTGKITDGKNTAFRCYAAMVEAIYPRVRKVRWNNFEVLKGKTYEQIVKILTANLPKNNVIRIHSSGDFYSEVYFRAWLTIARNNPDTTFYAYTKTIKYWIKYKDSIPANFKLNASLGGKYDRLVEENDLKFVRVVYSPEEANKLGLKIDIDDSLALLIHGIQKAGTLAAKASYKYRNYKKEIHGKI